MSDTSVKCQGISCTNFYHSSCLGEVAEFCDLAPALREHAKFTNPVDNTAYDHDETEGSTYTTTSYDEGTRHLEQLKSEPQGDSYTTR